MHYIIRDNTKEAFYRTLVSTQTIWVVDKIDATHFDDLAEAEQVCSDFRDYYATKGYGNELCVLACEEIAGEIDHQEVF